MSTQDWELLTYYIVVAFTALSCLVQCRNVRRAMKRHAAAERHPEDLGRLVVTKADQRNEWLRLLTHAGLFVALGWLIAVRQQWITVPQPVTFAVFIAGIAFVPAMLLLMSWNVERRDRRLNAP